MKTEHTPEPWAVGEYWSSSRPHTKVLVLSKGSDEILMDGAHRSFIRWVCKSEQVEKLEKERDAAYNIADHYRTSRDQSLLQYENQQAALILAKEALEHCKGVFDEVRGYPVTYDLVIEALLVVNKTLGGSDAEA